MGFTLKGLGPFLQWLTLVILCVLPVLVAYALYKLGELPGAIARERNHPQAEAINICGWMGSITIVLWPVAMVWAYLSTAQADESTKLSQNDANAIVGALQQASRRVAVVESKISTK
jgi:hypothetical protein